MVRKNPAGRSPAHAALIEMRGIVKHFPGVLANDQVDLMVHPGEVHALLGENGAGKSTLMNILSGLYHPDAGKILVEGVPHAFRSPRDAIQAGIGMVHQHFSLVDVFTVAENMIIGLDQPRWNLQLAEVEDTITAMGEKFGLRVDPRARIWQLSVGEQQRVEILKMLYRDANLLILDEPTAVLTPQEAEELAHTLRQMAQSGRAVLYISHKLREVLQVADRITVLRDGRNVDTVPVDAVDQKALTRMMVGRDLAPVEISGSRREPGETVFSIHELEVEGNRGNSAVNGLSLVLRAGEILGLAGVAGNGQRELAEAIVGLRPVSRGVIELDGLDVTHASPGDLIGQGVSLIPENCKEMGLIPHLDVYDNAILKTYRQAPISQGWFLNMSEVRAHASQLVEAFSVRTASLDEPVWKMSGGNLQRLMLGREIETRPRLLIAANPTRGLDIQAATEIRRLLLQQRDEGAAVLLVSEDLDELMQVSDRVGAIFNGRVVGVMENRAVDLEQLGLWMMGSEAPEKVQ